MKYHDECNEIMDTACCFGPVSDAAIAKAEEELKVVFPNEYRYFLARYGAATGVGVRIAGLFDSRDDAPPMWQSIVLATKQIRRATRGNLPHALLPISDDGAGRTFYINGVGGDACPVVAYGPGCDGEQVAESFDEFVVKLQRDEV